MSSSNYSALSTKMNVTTGGSSTRITPLNYISVSGDGAEILAATLGGEIGLWRIRDGARCNRRKQSNPIAGIHYVQEHGGWAIVEAGPHARFLLLSRGIDKLVASFEHREPGVDSNSVAFSENGGTVAIHSKGSCRVTVAKIGKDGRISVVPVKIDSPARLLGMSTCGSRIVGLSFDGRCSYGTHNEACVKQISELTISISRPWPSLETTDCMWLS